MNIAMINGSPKPAGGNSGFLLRTLEPLLGEGHDIVHYKPGRRPLAPEQYSELCRMDVLIFAFPLYFDGIPAQLFRMLITLEETMKAEHDREIHVYVMVNNGFYEGRQNRIALEMIQNWCVRCGLIFGQGLGQGSGEMLSSLKKVPLGAGPLKNLGSAMHSLADNIRSRSTAESRLFSPNFPRFAWRIAATHGFWNAAARKNGLKRKDLLRRL